MSPSQDTLIACLGGEWFSDSLALSDMNDKTAAEKLQGYWILEIGELAGMKKADIDKVKAFISRQDDKYRASFGRRVTPHPRQCVFFGTTNSENGYLRDITGNRRFWNVKVTGQGKYKPWDMTNEVVQQIWAEVAEITKAGEKLYLDADLEAFALGFQFFQPCLGGRGQDAHLNGVQHVLDGLFAYLELLAHGGDARVLPVLQIDDRIGNPVDFLIPKYALHGDHDGDPLNPVLFERLALAAEPALCTAALVIIVFCTVGAACSAFAHH